MEKITVINTVVYNIYFCFSNKAINVTSNYRWNVFTRVVNRFLHFGESLLRSIAHNQRDFTLDRINTRLSSWFVTTGSLKIAYRKNGNNTISPFHPLL